MLFTGKERDAETGLDYFGARYFSGPQGRFSSPDDVFVDQHPADPQSWNLYAYGRNNPLRYGDPDGHIVKEWLLRRVTGIAVGALGAAAGPLAVAGLFFDVFQGSAGSQGEDAALKALQDQARKADDEKSAEQEAEPEAASGGVKKGGGKKSLSSNRNILEHIFRDAEGHVNDTSANRELLQSIANDPAATLGTDKYGNTWSARIQADGTQVWTQTRGEL